MKQESFITDSYCIFMINKKKNDACCVSVYIYIYHRKRICFLSSLQPSSQGCQIKLYAWLPHNLANKSAGVERRVTHVYGLLSSNISSSSYLSFELLIVSE